MELAVSKTEIIMTNRKRIPEDFCFSLDNTDVKPAENLKYLGVVFDRKNNFRKQIQEVTDKGIRIMAALSRTMANRGGLRHGARNLYYVILESIVLYGAPIWAKAAKTGNNWRILKKTQKLGLARMASAYRTVPMETLAALTGILPWNIKVRERENLFKWETDFAEAEKDLEETQQETSWKVNTRINPRKG